MQCGAKNILYPLYIVAVTDTEHIVFRSFAVLCIHIMVLVESFESFTNIILGVFTDSVHHFARFSRCQLCNHYPNQCWNIIYWSLRNKIQWNLNQKSYILFKEKHLKMSSEKWRPFCLDHIVLKCSARNYNKPRQKRITCEIWITQMAINNSLGLARCGKILNV